jgi:hypothetical protein
MSKAADLRMRSRMKWLGRAIGMFAIALLAACKPHQSATPSHDAEIVLAASGAWNWIEDPRAVHVKGGRDRIYAGWVTRNGDLQIGAYDRMTTKIEAVTLAPHWEIDDHDSPSLLVLPDKRLMAFYARHNLIGVFVRTSLHPEDISAWGPEIAITRTPRTTYSQPVYLADEKKIYVFWRGVNWKPTFSTSTDGEHWTPERELVEQKGREANTIRPYFKIASDGRSKIDIAFTDGHPRDEPTNSIYYLRYEHGAFFKADGARVGGMGDLPIDPMSSDIVYFAKPSWVRAWIWDLAIARDGTPVIAYARYPSETDHRYRYARWRNGHWLDVELVAAGRWFPQTPPGTQEREPHYSGGIALDHDDPSIVYLSRQVDGQFEIERWATPDGGTSWATTPITAQSSEPNVRPVVARGDDGETVLWMRGPYVHWTNFGTRIMLLDQRTTSPR